MNNNENARFERMPDIGDWIMGFVLILLLAIIVIVSAYRLYDFFSGVSGDRYLQETTFKYPTTFISHRR